MVRIKNRWLLIEILYPGPRFHPAGPSMADLPSQSADPPPLGAPAPAGASVPGVSLGTLASGPGPGTGLSREAEAQVAAVLARDPAAAATVAAAAERAALDNLDGQLPLSLFAAAGGSKGGRRAEAREEPQMNRDVVGGAGGYVSPESVLRFHRPSPDGLTPQLLVRMIREAVAAMFGDFGAGKIGPGLAVKYLSTATSTAIVRVPRPQYRLVWAALTYHLNSIPVGNPWSNATRVDPATPSGFSTPAVFRVVRVSGTIKKVERALVARSLALKDRAILEVRAIEKAERQKAAASASGKKPPSKLAHLEGLIQSATRSVALGITQGLVEGDREVEGVVDVVGLAHTGAVYEQDPALRPEDVDMSQDEGDGDSDEGE